MYLENFVTPREYSDDVPRGEGNVQEKSHPNNVILSYGETVTVVIYKTGMIYYNKWIILPDIEILLYCCVPDGIRCQHQVVIM